MTLPARSGSRTRSRSASTRSRLLALGFLSTLAASAACASSSDDALDEEQNPSAGSGGTAGVGGSAGDAGSSGSGSAGSAGDAGSGGSGGSGSGGSGGDAGEAGSAGDAGSGGSAGTGGAAGEGGAGGSVDEGLTIERWGARLYGNILALSRQGRHLWVGTNSQVDPYTSDLRAGLAKLDLDTGDLTVYEKELPSYSYNNQASGPMPTAGVIEDTERTLVVGRGGVMVLKDGVFTLHPLEYNGMVATPINLVLDRQGTRSRLWVSSNLGLLALNADSLEVEKVYSLVDLDVGELGRMAIDPSDGSLYTVGFSGPQSKGIKVQAGIITSFVPGEGGVPAGRLNDVVFNASKGVAYFTAASWDAQTGGVLAWDGTSSPTSLATEGQLSTAARGDAVAFGTALLALDEEAGLLIVGGQIQPSGQLGPLVGGGLVWLDLKTGQMVGLVSGKAGLPGSNVTSLAYDPETRRVHAALGDPCNELHMASAGLFSISFRDDGTPRYERPILSTVRAVARDNKQSYVGLRDENPSMSCTGYPIQQGLLTLQKNHSGELIPMQNVFGLVDVPPYYAVSHIELSEHDSLAIALERGGALVGDPRAGVGYNPAAFDVSQAVQSVAWKGPSALWFAGPAKHADGDPADAADFDPKGASLIELDEQGKVISYKHFVRNSKIIGPNDVIGLPSSNIASVVVAPNGTSYLACATERYTNLPLDRDIGEVFELGGVARKGGVVSINGQKIVLLAGADAAPDPRAAALAEDGSLIVLDAEKGALRVNEDGVSPFTLPASPPDGAIPVSLWLGKNGDLVAGYSKGAVVSLGGHKAVLNDLGWVWKTIERAPGVLMLGTDVGLVKVVLDGAEEAAEQDVEPGAPPPFADDGPVDPQGGAGGSESGECLGPGSICGGNTKDCCPGLSCGGVGFVMQCQ